MPSWMLEKEAQQWFGKSYNELNPDDQIFCEEMALDYAGMNQAEYEQNRGEE